MKSELIPSLGNLLTIKVDEIKNEVTASDE